ncbi:hypothetical protein IPF37_05975 [bacterium]|nr:MAG: hypothetical protein IPF37_05975 [bacterium]
MNNKKILEKKLNQNGKNIDLLFKLALLEIEPPEGDDVKCIAYLEQILALDKDNVQALILFAYLHYYNLFEHAEEDLINKLISLKSPSDELNSMLRYAASWAFQFKGNSEKQIFFLKESIALDPKNVFHYVGLAYNYFEQGKDLEAKELVKKALGNIKKVYTDDPSEYDETNLNDFLGNNIKGTYLTQQMVNIIQKMLDQ